jgi:3-isopropylmalate/(R)-2-methylmalate dehydratase small subunit
MNNGLLAVMLPEAAAAALLAEARDSAMPLQVEIDILAATMRTSNRSMSFSISDRHRTMLISGLDMIGASLMHTTEINEFARRHWARQPWVRDVARRVMQRLEGR